MLLPAKDIQPNQSQNQESPKIDGADRLELDWPIDGQGYPHRAAERVILISADQKVLLIKGHDFTDPQHTWWFTIGGGKEPGEKPIAAAARELEEETGIKLPLTAFQGPVLRRKALFKFRSVWAKQDEEFFLVHWPEKELPNLTADGWTEVEHELLDEFRWFSLEELTKLTQTETVYPQRLADYLGQWLTGWDGKTIEISDIPREE